MATTHDYLQGKVKWAKLDKPDTRFGDARWKLTLYPDPTSYDKIVKLKESPAIKNNLAKDEDGYYMSFGRRCSQMIKGRLTTFSPPEILDGSKPLPEGGYQPLREVLIGNGSDCTIKIEIYDYITPAKNKERAVRLESVRVDNLVPYSPARDFDEDQKKLVKGMDDQPIANPGF